MIVSTGIDIVEVERIKEMGEKHGDKFLKRSFTPREIKYCAARKYKYEHFAARFAAKEAVMKTLRAGLGSVGLNEPSRLNITHISNAAAMMQAAHVYKFDNWEEHLRGLARSANIMIGRGESYESEAFSTALRFHFDSEYGLQVYRRPMRLHYSSTKQTAALTLA